MSRGRHRAAGPARGAMRRVARRWRYMTNAGAAVLSVIMVLWTLIPLYNMVMVALEAEGDVFSDHFGPPHRRPTASGSSSARAIGISSISGTSSATASLSPVMVTLLVLVIGSLTTFSVARMRIRNGWLITNAALLTYVIPASFLAIPFYLIMQNYGLHNNPWSVIAALVTFATPYAIFIFHGIRQQHPARARRVGADRRRLAAPDLFQNLPAADGAGIGRGRHLRAAAGVERVSVPVPAAVEQSAA